jgi:hypothetical protein
MISFGSVHGFSQVTKKLVQKVNLRHALQVEMGLKLRESIVSSRAEKTIIFNLRFFRLSYEISK